MGIKKKVLKTFLIILGTILVMFFTVVGFIIYKWNTDTTPCIPDTPARIGQIPSTAKWIGGCDGGHWFDVVEMLSDKNQYRIAVYFDYNGKLYVDDYFKLSCDKKIQTKDELLSKILYYEGEIRMKDGCDLIPIKSQKK